MKCSRCDILLSNDNSFENNSINGKKYCVNCYIDNVEIETDKLNEPDYWEKLDSKIYPGEDITEIE